LYGDIRGNLYGDTRRKLYGDTRRRAGASTREEESWGQGPRHPSYTYSIYINFNLKQIINK
jgi:hypothetical protein